MNTNKRPKIYMIPILCIGLLVAIDQLTKHIVRSSFALYESKPLIKDVFHLTYIQNTGAAWGMLKGKIFFFVILTLAFFILCSCIYARVKDDKRFTPIRVCLVFLVSGAIGNMIDRIKLHYVVDFFDFRLINFPVFNVADIYVTVSMFVLLVLCLFYYKDEDIDKIVSFKYHKPSKNEKSEDT
ncbi:MAG: signal peptidase II [Wujia sp.]